MSLQVVFASQSNITDFALERAQLLVYPLDMAGHVLPLAKGLVADAARERLVPEMDSAAMLG